MRREKDGGFTFIEVMVAMALIAIALAVTGGKKEEG